MTPERASARKHWLGFLVACLALWAVALAAAAGGLAGLTVALRIVASGLVLGAWALIFKCGPRRLLLSPLTHLAAFALLFYGWFPAFSVVLMDLNLNEGLFATRDNYHFVASYVGSRSELLVVGFAGLCLGAFAIAAAMLSEYRRADTSDFRYQSPYTIGWGAIAGIICLMLVLALSASPQFSALLGAPIGKELFSATPVLFSFSCAFLISTFGSKRRGHVLLGFLVIISGLFLLTFVNRAQMPLLITYALVSFIITLISLSARQLTLIALSCAIFLSAIMVALVVFRPAQATYAPATLMQRILIMAEQKLLTRQAVSAGCFNKIADLGFEKDAGGNPFYFVVAVVPRVLWREKPNLSRGSEFAELCGEGGAFEAGHSESITVLGEPILEDGYRGLVVAEVTLVVALVVLSVFGLTGGPVRMLWLVALLPWLIAVEQHFALYVANAFKMGLILVPAALALHWVLGRLAMPVSSSDDEAARSARLGVG